MLTLTNIERFALLMVRRGRPLPQKLAGRLEQRHLLCGEPGDWHLTRAGLWALSRGWQVRLRSNGIPKPTLEHRAAALAARIGVDPDEYLARRLNGQMWCHPCREWHGAGMMATKGACREGWRAYNNQRYHERRR